MKSFFLASLLTVLLNYSKGKVTLINVLNLTDSPETHDRNIVDKDTIVVGVLLPRNVEGNNDVVAKVRKQIFEHNIVIIKDYGNFKAILD